MKKFEHGGNIYGKNIRLDFSVNTNPLGIDEKVKNAVIENTDSFGIYPDTEYRSLCRAIAEKEGVEKVLCSNGASEMIFAVTRAVMPKKALIISPSFSEYERAFLSVGCDMQYYNLSEVDNFSIHEDFLNALSYVDMAFVCNPNNPTGNIFDKSVMESAAGMCRENGIVLVFDECFMDMAYGYSMKGKAPVIKAFTKTYAMAGLRLGYLIADAEFTDKVKAQLPAWNVSAAAVSAGLAAAEDTEYIRKSIALVEKERAYLSGELSKIGFKVFNSETNFLLIKGGVGLAEKMLQKGILIRDCSNFIGLDGHFYRIAVKTHDENKELIKELGDICG